MIRLRQCGYSQGRKYREEKRQKIKQLVCEKILRIVGRGSAVSQRSIKTLTMTLEGNAPFYLRKKVDSPPLPSLGVPAHPTPCFTTAKVPPESFPPLARI